MKTDFGVSRQVEWIYNRKIPVSEGFILEFYEMNILCWLTAIFYVNCCGFYDLFYNLLQLSNIVHIFHHLFTRAAAFSGGLCILSLLFF